MKPQESRTPQRTENFFTRNVRLITFLAVVAAFLAVTVMLGVIVHGDFLFDFSENDTRPEMTVEEMREICARAATVTGAELSAWRGENYDRKIDGVTVEKYYYINNVGGRYNLSATVRASDGRMVYFALYDLETKEMIDLLDKKSDLDAFLGN